MDDLSRSRKSSSSLSSDNRRLSKKQSCFGCGCLILLLPFILFIISLPFQGYIADLIWYRSLGVSQVLTTQVGTIWMLFGGTALAVIVACTISLVIAHTLAKRGDKAVDNLGDLSLEEVAAASALPWVVGITVAAFVSVMAIFAGLATMHVWQDLLLWQHASDFTGANGQPVTDPNFGMNLSYFLFTLPIQSDALAWAGGLLEIVFLATALFYAAMFLTNGSKHLRLIAIHLSTIFALRVLLGAFGFMLKPYALSWSHNGWATGVAAQDINATIPIYHLLAFLTVVAAIVIFVTPFVFKQAWISGIVATATTVIMLILPLIFAVAPLLNQQFAINPNQYVAEQQYINNNITMTRLSYGLSDWQTQNYPATADLTAADLTADAATLNNVRLWDYRPLTQTLDQLQTVRQYYSFYDTDIDRYVINNQEQQVMLSARELKLGNIPDSQNFINSHLLYTHGYGVVMVPTNAVTSEGLPQLIIKDMPVTSSNGAPAVNQPQIYFGEHSTDWVMVGAKMNEFDAPSNSTSGDTTTRWTGTNGINISDPLAKLFWASQLGSFNLLFTDQVTPSSQILLNRDLTTRINKIAPFLTLDSDPYIVVTSTGRLMWIVDGYTTSTHMPDVPKFNTDNLPDGSNLKNDNFNYVRNSVKVTMDAYTGAVNLYENDPTDPIIRAWEGVFPGLIQPLANMPADLVAHLRAPEELLNVQALQYGTYHVTDTSSFYQSNDLWTVPQGSSATSSANGQVLPTEAYYALIRLPGQTTPEYMLMQPFVPKGRPNMISWVGVRNDGANRGQVVVFNLSRDTSVYGPNQIEARIEQDPTMSEKISLWNQEGSKVIRGNLLVLPVGAGFLYVEPLYLQGSSAAFPELTRVIVATSQRVAWGENLQVALNNLLAASASSGTGSTTIPGAGSSPTPPVTPSPATAATPTPLTTAGPTPTVGPSGSPTADGLPSDVKGLIAYANNHYAAAQAALKNGDAGGLQRGNSQGPGGVS
jgi:uncharacterized membrane protein (UPF0182 family)